MEKQELKGQRYNEIMPICSSSKRSWVIYSWTSILLKIATKNDYDYSP